MIPDYFVSMRPWHVLALAAWFALPAEAQVGRAERKSRLEQDPGVVDLVATIRKPVELAVVRDAPVFADKAGRQKLGTLLAGQKVRLEAMTDQVYRVRGQGAHDGVAGWVAPWAFSSRDPNFVENLRRLYHRQIEVRRLVEARQLAVGMTMHEVELARGRPTRTERRKTGAGQHARWEYVEYKEVKHYATVRDPYTGAIYRQLVNVTREEKEKTVVEFENGLVTVVEESESPRRRGAVRVVVPPVLIGW